VYLEQNATWNRIVERAHDADILVRHELEELESSLLDKAHMATQPKLDSAQKQFVKQQKKLNKKFKYAVPCACELVWV
jgi:hypothetical protein